MSNEKNVKETNAKAEDVKGELTYEDKVIQKIITNIENRIKIERTKVPQKMYLER